MRNLTKKNLLVLGDSCTYGHGCSDRAYYWDPVTKKHVGSSQVLDQGPSDFCWASILQRQHTDLKIINLARPGKDNTSCFIDALIEHADILDRQDIHHVIFSMTFDDRQQIASPLGFASNGFEEQTQDRPVNYFKDYLPLITWNPSWDLSSWAVNRDWPADYTRALELYSRRLYSPAWGAKIGHMSLYAAAGWACSLGARFHWAAPASSFANTSNYIDPVLKSRQIPHILDYLESQDRLSCFCIDGHPNDLGHALYHDAIIESLLDLANGEGGI